MTTRVAASSPAFVVWTHACSVGTEVLDHQHQNLVQLINNLYLALRQQKGTAVVKETLQELETYTCAHFATEEAMLRNCGYPDLEAHKELHRTMRERTQSLRIGFHARKQDISQAVLDFLKEWWLDHIVKCDRTYTPYVRKTAPT